ncbi:MAG: hypothetical protein WA960_14285 [Tunicatimonas sp.]
MELEELRTHWHALRSADSEFLLSEEELSALLPDSRPLFQRILLKTSRYVAVYGFLFICCSGC